MKSDFDEIVLELGEQLSFPLQPDSEGRCSILIEEAVHIQIEYQGETNRILVIATLSELVPGPLRGQIVTRALIDNGGSDYHAGHFAYSRQANQLVLQQYIPMQDLDGKRLYGLLELFAVKAWQWHQGCKSGNLPQPHAVEKSSPKPRLGRAEL